MTWRLSRILGILLSVALLRSADQPAWTMPDAQRQAIRDLADRVAAAAGLPDARTGKWFRGTLKWSSADGTTAKPDDENTPPRESTTGIHALMPDGSWMMNLVLHLAPASRRIMDEQGLKPISQESAFAFDADTLGVFVGQQQQMIGDIRFASSLLPMVTACVQASAPLHPCSVNWVSQAFRRPTVLCLAALIHSRLPGSEELLVLEAARLLHRDPVMLHMPLHDRLLLHEKEIDFDDFGESPPRIGSLDPARYLCWEIRREAANVLLDEDDRRRSALTFDQLLAVARNVLPGVDADAWRSLQRLQEQQTLTSPVRRSGMDDRLIFWRCHPDGNIPYWDPWPDPAVWWDSIPPPERLDLGRLFEERQADALMADDADTLVACAGDLRLSRWHAGRHPRTIGDQALRALTSIWLVDPRHLLGRDDNAFWTDAERLATAAALKAWWATSRHRPMDEVIVEAVPRLCLRDLARCLWAWPEKRRQPLIEAIARAWARQPAADEIPDDLATILAITIDDAHMRQAVAAWPIAGSFHRRLVLAAWHLHHGRPGPLLDMAKLQLDPNAGSDLRSRWDHVAALLETIPSADLLRRIIACCDAEFRPPWEQRVFLAPLMRDSKAYPFPASRFLDAVRHGARPWQKGYGDPVRLGTAMSDAVYWHLLQDRRSGTDRLNDPSPARICDQAATLAAKRDWRDAQMHLDEVLTTLSFDPKAPLTDRDVAIARIRQEIGPLITAKLRAAGLGAMIRELGLPEPPAEPAF